MTSLTARLRFGLRSPLALLPALVLAASSLTTMGAQSVTGVMPNWKDLETWSLPISREIDQGLGLQLASSGGVMMVSFSARVPQNSTAPPKDVFIVTAPSLVSNPNVLRTPSLRFTADPRTRNEKSFDLSGTLRVDDPSPGAIISSASSLMRTEDFIRLCQAIAITGNVFGSDVTLRDDQIKALRALAERLHIVVPKLPVAVPARGAQ